MKLHANEEVKLGDLVDCHNTHISLHAYGKIKSHQDVH